MDTPWSITGEQVMISKPDLPWEQIGYQVNEGPAVLIRNGRVFITYSASATDFNYCLGLLTAKDDADLLDPKSWTKSQRPVFATWTVNGVYGPGHNSFTTTPDGKTDIFVYHARQYRDIKGDPLNDPNRHTRAQVLRYNADGTPDFNVPVADGPQTAETGVPVTTTSNGTTPTVVKLVQVLQAVTVHGQVYKTGAFPLPADGKMTLASVIRLAGGPNPSADRYVEIHRIQPDGTTLEMRNVDMTDALRDPAKDVPLQAGDEVFVYPSFKGAGSRRP
jgi:hypothetical protein